MQVYFISSKSSLFPIAEERVELTLAFCKVCLVGGVGVTKTCLPGVQMKDPAGPQLVKAWACQMLRPRLWRSLTNTFWSAVAVVVLHSRVVLNTKVLFSQTICYVTFYQKMWFVLCPANGYPRWPFHHPISCRCPRYAGGWPKKTNWNGNYFLLTRSYHQLMECLFICNS